MLILCLKGRKMGVPDPKRAQKCRFCARKGRNRVGRTLNKHKNLNFVLEKPENGGTKLKKSTKMAFLCLGLTLVLTLGLRLGLSLRLSWFLGLVCR